MAGCKLRSVMRQEVAGCQVDEIMLHADMTNTNVNKVQEGT